MLLLQKEVLGMRILVLNTRDAANPSSGGAEVYIHELCRRWVDRGNCVTLVAAGFRGAKATECIDGIEIIRLGRFPYVYAIMRNYYNKHLRGKFDIVIDAYTLRPFQIVHYSKEPVIFLVFELAREKYFHVLPPLLSHAGYYWLEPSWLKGYRDKKTITISNSTKNDLIEFGFSDVDVVPVGLKAIRQNSGAGKEITPTFLYVGMLKKLNLIDDVLCAFQYIIREIPDARLLIAGRGPDQKRLEKIAEGNNNITFFGFVDETKKYELMSRAHVLLMPAIREGWGMVVTESNACGTPVVGYDVPGLRDSIRHEVTGFLTERNPRAMASSAIRVIKDRGLGNKLSMNARGWSTNFSWDRSAVMFFDILEQERKKVFPG